MTAGGGRFLQDFEPGMVIRHPRGRTISEADNTWFTLLTMNTNQVHFNTEYARRMPLGRVLVNSGFTVALVLGMSVAEISENAIANLGWERIDLTHPVYVGDTLWAESLILDVRESRSRQYAGIVRARTRGLNQDGVTCVTFVRSVMVPKRSERDRVDAFPTPVEPIEGS